MTVRKQFHKKNKQLNLQSEDIINQIKSSNFLTGAPYVSATITIIVNKSIRSSAHAALPHYKHTFLKRPRSNNETQAIS